MLIQYRADVMLGCGQLVHMLVKPNQKSKSNNVWLKGAQFEIFEIGTNKLRRSYESIQPDDLVVRPQLTNGYDIFGF